MGFGMGFWVLLFAFIAVSSFLIWKLRRYQLRGEIRTARKEIERSISQIDAFLSLELDSTSCYDSRTRLDFIKIFLKCYRDFIDKILNSRLARRYLKMELKSLRIRYVILFHLYISLLKDLQEQGCRIIVTDKGLRII